MWPQINNLREKYVCSLKNIILCAQNDHLCVHNANNNLCFYVSVKFCKCWKSFLVNTVTILLLCSSPPCKCLPSDFDLFLWSLTDLLLFFCEFIWVAVKRLQSALILSGAHSHKRLQGCLCRSLFSQTLRKRESDLVVSLWNAVLGIDSQTNSVNPDEQHSSRAPGKITVFLKMLVFAFTAGKQWNVLIRPGHRFSTGFARKMFARCELLCQFVPSRDIQPLLGIYSQHLCLRFEHVYNLTHLFVFMFNLLLDTK